MNKSQQNKFSEDFDNQSDKSNFSEKQRNKIVAEKSQQVSNFKQAKDYNPQLQFTRATEKPGSSDGKDPEIDPNIRGTHYSIEDTEKNSPEKEDGNQIGYTDDRSQDNNN